MTFLQGCEGRQACSTHVQNQPSQAVDVAAEPLDAVDVLEVVSSLRHAGDELEGPLEIAAVLLERGGQLHKVLGMRDRLSAL